MFTALAWRKIGPKARFSSSTKVRGHF
jgi:hypothetical protein